ncbi:MAG: zf-HC2 domain-containing protein [Deltaproteobacteria bacterium]|nr:zf-HC2 domain-containing protein [Deltaproteobacteria bacterium]
MTCRHCQRLLSPHLDNALAAHERESVLAHLAHCPACSERLHQLASNRQLLRSLPAAEVTSAMEMRLQSRVQSLGSRVRSSEFGVRSPKSTVRNPQSAIPSWWRGWGLVSVGTLATAAASFLLYISTLQAPAEVSAEEVVSSMDQLLNALDPDDGVNIFNEETAEETVPNWREELDPWFSDDDND